MKENALKTIREKKGISPYKLALIATEATKQRFESCQIRRFENAKEVSTKAVRVYTKALKLNDNELLELVKEIIK